MRKVSYIFVIFLLAMLFLINTSFAEENFIVRSGVLWQSGNDTANQTDFAIGGEYIFPGKYYTGAFSATADFIGAKKVDGTSESLVPVMLNYKWYGIENIHVTVGIGLFAVGGKNFGFQGIGTIPLKNNWFIEGRFIGRSNTTGCPNSFCGLEIGYKF